MKIQELTATFGKLDGSTLRLEDGLNVICEGNEWGKSTWCGFLTAMFYGIDTRERSGKDALADKEYYQPWSGKPMEGRMRLTFQGQDITIERRSRGKVPMGEFRAYDTETGLTIRELTGENCGQMLLGVEKSVFLRSGLIRQKEMPVTQDEALRRRLNSLVTIGDDSDTQDRLGEKLRELKNRCRYNRSGLIPQAQQRLEQLRGQLQERELMQQRLRAACQEEKQLRQQQQTLENHKQWLTYRQFRQDEARVERTIEKLAAVRQQVEALRKACEAYPGRSELEEKLRQREPARQPKPLPGAAGAVCLAVGMLTVTAALAVTRHSVGMLCAGILTAVSGVLAGVQILRRKREIKKRETEAETRRSLQKQQEQWLDQLHRLQELERCEAEEKQTRQHLQELEAMLRTIERPQQQDELTLTPEQTRHEEDQIRQRLRQVQLVQGQFRGRMEGLPEEEPLQKQIEQTRSRLEELELTYTALGYAQKALEEATQQLQKRFAPRISSRAQELFSRMTSGRYDRISLAEDLTLTAAAAEEVTQRSALWRSSGTADQMYLALRLAVWEALMPEGILVLDDALARFDDQRLTRTLEILKEMSDRQQIILFSCQNREKEILKKL